MHTRSVSFSNKNENKHKFKKEKYKKYHMKRCTFQNPYLVFHNVETAHETQNRQPQDIIPTLHTSCSHHCWRLSNPTAGPLSAPFPSCE